VLTENYAALPIVEEELLKKKEEPVIIFGSSFPKDQEYTQVPTNVCSIGLYGVHYSHTEGSIKLHERKQRTSGAEVNHFITRNLHQLAFTRYAFFSSVQVHVSRSNAIDDLPNLAPLKSGVKLGLWNESHIYYFFFM